MGPLARHEERVAYLFLSPWLIGLLVFIIGPIVASIFISLTDWNLMNPPRWVGTANYEKMLGDRDFYNSMRVTLKYVALSVPLYLVLGLALALLLNQRLKGMFIFRSILFMPSVIAGTAVAVLWSISAVGQGISARKGNRENASDLSIFCEKFLKVSPVGSRFPF